MGELTYQQFMTAIVVILGIMTGYNTFCTARSNRRKERERMNSPVVALQDIAKDHEKRIEVLEKQSLRHTDESKLILRGLVALLHHEVDGNNTAGLKASQEEITDYLLDK